jgi:hypothetical protein
VGLSGPAEDDDDDDAAATVMCRRVLSRPLRLSRPEEPRIGRRSCDADADAEKARCPSIPAGAARAGSRSGCILRWRCRLSPSGAHSHILKARSSPVDLTVRPHGDHAL